MRTPDQALGPRRRLLDGLVGAVVALVLLALLVVGALWWWGRSPDPAAVPDPGAAPPPPPAAPADLGPDETWLGDVQLGSGELVGPDGALTDITATGTDVRFGPDGMVAGRLDVEATVPFGQVAAQVGEGVTLARAGDEVVLTRTIELFGRDVGVEATGTVRADDGLLVVEPTSIDLGGPDVLARAAADVVNALVTIRQPVEGLPEGLVLQDVAVVDAGFRAVLAGEGVRLGG